jgi:peptidoglycan/xylan/chitin deacetylase (PgdA/CDA1 family)
MSNAASTRSRSISLIHDILAKCGFHKAYRLYHRVRAFKNIAILMYHAVDDAAKTNSVTVAAFRRHMNFISRNCEVIRLPEISRHLGSERDAGDEPGRKARIAVTIDDAFESVRDNAHEVMEEMGIPYTVFVPTGHVDKYSEWEKYPKKIMSADQLQELSRSELVDIGSHTVNHVSMASLSIDRMREEAVESRQYLGNLLGDSDVIPFAYPYGGIADYSRRTTAVLKEAGFGLAVTTRYGCMNSAGDLYRLRRIQFEEEDGEDTLHAKISGCYDWYYLKETMMYPYRILKKK